MRRGGKVTLRFSAEGPEFPEQLVDALLTGEVVFLCGAGISAPQLPGFEGLVEQTFAALNLDMTPSEALSFRENRFEEALGSLSRRIVDPAEMIRTVVGLLTPPEHPDLGHHATILRLSRDLENRPAIVTTNFDTLIERAFRETEEVETARALSFAGQDLPSPGSAGFGGIIHIHGRIADAALEMEETPLIVTSADYGDAYMRSGWASRFLFDLCRCRTIVLVGYSAGDAPVRYFLNVLEADRQRFRDLNPVYALDAVEARDQADMRWEALAVIPIPYEYRVDDVTGQRSHDALWTDLGVLADLVERPKATRRQWAADILAKPLADATPAELDHILWLFSGRRDLDQVAIETITDYQWLDFLTTRTGWTDRESIWVGAAWIGREWTSIVRFKLALRWMERLGQPFAAELARRIGQAKDIPELWLRAWRLLVISRPRRNMGWDDRAYSVQETLRGPLVLSADLQKAVQLLTPVLTFTANRDELYGEHTPDPPQRLRDLAWIRLSLDDSGGASDLLDALLAVPQPLTIISLATTQLQLIAALSLDAALIVDDYDSNDSAVPSVEPHEQNAHHDGPVFLVLLLAQLLQAASNADRNATRHFTDLWRTVPGILGVRLWMHALRNDELYTANEAITGLQSLPRDIFWNIRREFALALRDRAADADQAAVAALEQRILAEGGDYYARYTIEEGQPDWRAHARDSEVWLRLRMLEQAGALSPAGNEELAAIKARRDYLDRDVEDRDFFGSYSYGIRTVVGDATPIIEANEDDRLQVAHEVLQSHDIEKQQGWALFCRTDPRGAFDTLSNAPLDTINAPLWNSLLSALSFPEGERDAALRELIVQIFACLEPADDPFIELIVTDLANLYWSAPRLAEPRIAAWLPRLFARAVHRDTAALDPARDINNDAMNSAAGRVTEALLLDIEHYREEAQPVPLALIEGLHMVAGAEGRQGAFARASLIRVAGFVLSIEGQQIGPLLDAALTGDGVEATALRTVLVNNMRLSSVATRAFGRHILHGAMEVGEKGDAAKAVASKIIAPPLSILRGEQNADHWGITIEDVRRVLRTGPPALRYGAAALLKQWIHQLDGERHDIWRVGIGPLLAAVWPRARALREQSLARHFADLAVGTGEAYPEALAQLMPFLSPIEGHGGTYAIEKSTAPDQFPRETLSLLWKLFGPGSTANLYGVPKILDRLIAALPAIELDRRFQWLEQRAIRYD